MERCDVLIVGGGPGGSSCARSLVSAGLDVVVLDRKTFPRDKICAGWITPQIIDTLEIDLADYQKKQRILAPIHGFRIQRIGSDETTVSHGEVVSYGIRRCEFDHYLLERSGAKLRMGEALGSLRRQGDGWIVNEAIEAKTVVGAGGHFCPVARLLGVRPGSGEPTVVAREIEFALTPEQLADCKTHPQIPELFFTADLRGYGWVVHKGDYLNVGLGRQDTKAFPKHVETFLDWLEAKGRVPKDLPRDLHGHAYLLYDQAPRPLSSDGVLLVGDAAGMAYGKSGEGIRPAVEAGILAARALAASGGQADAHARNRYEHQVKERLGPRHDGLQPGITDWIPERWRGPFCGWLLAQPLVGRRLVIDRWFLHRHQPVLAPAS